MLMLLLACTTEPQTLTAALDTAGETPLDTAAPDTDDTEDTDDDTDPEGCNPDDTDDTKDTDEGDDTAGLTALDCFAGQGLLVDYDQYAPVIGDHCMGTNHQDIFGVEHVVFIGDSITVGTPPTDAGDWYRNQMADTLGATYGLDAPSWAWENVDLFNGMSYELASGGFSSCAKWGARTDDLTQAPHEQMQTCIPEDRRDEVTLVVMTIGGNDLFSWAQDLADGMGEDQLWAEAEAAIADLEESVAWLTEPGRFPNGVYLVFANTFEFTDAESAQDFSTCTGADWIGMDTMLVDPMFTAAAGWMMEEYMRISVQSGTDLVFMGEHTCGHGYMFEDPSGRCYRGSGAELWLDLTCMHPSASGHTGIADLFLSVIEE